MTLEVKPVGVTCNLRCTYCYEEPMRDVEPIHKYNKAAVFAQLETATGAWSLFGGEALLLPLNDLEELLALGFNKWGRTGIQTNGTLITDRHIELFDKYRCSVGISMDGPGELNDSRWNHTLEATRKSTQRSEDAVYKLLELSRIPGKEHLMPSLIVTLQKTNADVDRWPRMKEWVRMLDEMGLRFINFHLMEMDSDAHELYLPHERLKEVMLDLWEFSTTLKNVRFSNFKEITDLLRGNDSDVMCVWHACDPWNTAAVQGVENDGSPSKCGRANKDGIDWLPSEGGGAATVHQIGGFRGTTLHDRQLSLYVTPQEDGGCKDCAFWLMCQGQCPGTGDTTEGKPLGDWRLRSSHCQTFKDMFEEGEKRLLAAGEVPLSRSPNRKAIEEIMYAGWAKGESPSMGGAIKDFLARREGRVTSQQIVPGKRLMSPHGDAPHGDHIDANPDNSILRPHVDVHVNTHGDHVDLLNKAFRDATILKDTGPKPRQKHSDSYEKYNEPTVLRNSPRNHGDHVDTHGDHYDLIPPTAKR